MEVKFEVKLLHPVTGQVIADALSALAGKNFIQKIATAGDNGRTYEIGRTSLDPYEQVIIGVGLDGVTQISLGKEYDKVFVLSHQFPGGMIHAVGYTDEDVIEAVKSFRDTLEAYLQR